MRLNAPAPVKRPMRRALESLLEQSHYTQHIGAEYIDKFFREGPRSVVSHMQDLGIIYMSTVDKRAVLSYY